MSIKCAICEQEIAGRGNDPWPIKLDGVCCDACNMSLVVPTRISEVNPMNTVKTMVVNVKCVICESSRSILVPTSGYKAWAQGKKRIQDALPGLSAEDRELLLSNICPTCWDKHFSEE